MDYLRYGSGHLHGMLLDKERLIDLERDDNHREVKRQFAKDLELSSYYDKAGRLTGQHTQSGKYVKQTVLKRDYSYDGADRLTQIKDSRKGEISYQYDPINRLLKANGPLGEERFSFDPAHNILSKQETRKEDSSYTPSSTLPAGTSKVLGNILRGIAGTHFSYDARGNMTRKEGAKGLQTFEWDAHNQLRRSTIRDAKTNTALNTQYLYDAFGRRIAKRVEDADRESLISQTLYDWDGVTIASEEPTGTSNLAGTAGSWGQSQQAANTYTTAVNYLYEDGSFVPLAQYVNTPNEEAELTFRSSVLNDIPAGANSAETSIAKATTAKVYHYVCDQIGTPQVMLNNEQQVVWEAEAKAWGETLVIEGEASEKVVNNHRFQGQYFDAESYLHYNTFRYYDPELGRFISQDPIGLLGGINYYQYAPNPVEWVDPAGLKPKVPPFHADKLLSDIVRYKRKHVEPIKSSYSEAINEAWRQEAMLVRCTGSGTRDWNPKEKQEIIKLANNPAKLKSVMSKEYGYTGHHINNAKAHPEWEGDPRNIIFLKNKKHTDKLDEHLYSYQGHRGNYGNVTEGRLIDRMATLNHRLRQ